MAKPATNWRRTGARRCRSPSGWAAPRNTAPSCKASSKTTTSTAKSSGWMVRCASRRNSAGAFEREVSGTLVAEREPSFTLGAGSVLAGRQLGCDRAEVVSLEGLVLRGQCVVDGRQDRALEVHVENSLGALDGLLRQLENLARGLQRFSQRVGHGVVGQSQFDGPRRGDPGAG